MKLFIDCLPCMLRQVLEATFMATTDEVIQEKIMLEAAAKLTSYKDYCCAPKLCQDMHSIVKAYTGIEDPYAGIKSRDISEALKIELLIRNFTTDDKDLLLQTLKASATGNVMDSALYKDLNIEECIIDELEKPFKICDKDIFENDLKNAKRILIIGDNAGEVVFDKFLAEYLSEKYEVIYAVRENPIINDATIADALKTGIASHAKIISTGCGAPGAVLESCSPEFKEIFDNAELVISKGQGNFEALSDSDRRIYFLLKAKCPRIASALSVQVNEYVFKKNLN